MLVSAKFRIQTAATASHQCNDGVDNDSDGVTDFDGGDGDQSCDDILDDSEDFVDCPCFSSADIADNGSIVECGSNFPGFPDLTGLFWEGGRQACSGSNCAGTAPQDCAIQPISDGTFISPVNAAQDATCRAHILANCTNPNAPAVLSAAPAPSATAFMD